MGRGSKDAKKLRALMEELQIEANNERSEGKLQSTFDAKKRKEQDVGRGGEGICHLDPFVQLLMRAPRREDNAAVKKKIADKNPSGVAVRSSTTERCFGLPWTITEQRILLYLDFSSLTNLCEVYSQVQSFVHHPEDGITPGKPCYNLLSSLCARTCGEKLKKARKAGAEISKKKYSFLELLQWCHGCLPKSHRCYTESAQNIPEVWSRKLLKQASSHKCARIHKDSRYFSKWSLEFVEFQYEDNVKPTPEQVLCPHGGAITIVLQHAQCADCGLKTLLSGFR